MLRLSLEERITIANAMFLKTYEPEVDVIQVGQKGDEYYIVESGTCEAFVYDDGSGYMAKKTLKSGEGFGELALFNKCPRSATVRTIEESSLWVLDRHTFNKVIVEASKEKKGVRFAILNKMKLLGNSYF
jgi:cAMP-dependent protein kinase regulator